MANKGDSSGLSIISEEKVSARKHQESGDYELGNNHKIRSAYGGNKKKTHPLMLGPGRQSQGKLFSIHSASKNNLSEFTQRIMSAKLLRVKQIQNQLNETQMQLNELLNENKILRNMQKRQEGALKRYEGNQAELPQLIRSHNEEIRILKSNNKLIKAQLRESNLKLKERENELENLKENYTKLKKLSTEKNLLEREKLQKKVDDLQEVIREQEEKIQVLSRKILLESKNYRHHLNVEMLKHKETQKDLNSALSMISKLESQLLVKDRTTGKVLLKRESKNIMPFISNKPADIQFKMVVPEEVFLPQANEKKNFYSNDSPDSELEILNLVESSENTPSPNHDIFPDLIKSRKSSLELDRITERCISASELYSDSKNDVSLRKSSNTPAPKKSSSILRTSRLSADVEANAKEITEKLTENMDIIDDLVQKVEKHSSIDYRKTKLSHVTDEAEENKTSALQNESTKNEATQKIFEGGEVKTIERDGKRSVPKRKFDESLKMIPEVIETEQEAQISEELSSQEQQKLATMTKTWNELKGKIQEERKKAEEKMKELNQLNGGSGSASTNSDDDMPEVESSPQEMIKDPSEFHETKELRFVNFATDDAYILEELKKTDKVFNRLKNESKMPFWGKSSSLSMDKNPKVKVTTPKLTPKPRQQDIKSYKTESHRDPKYLEEFQSEYQKQNLIKALKAIDNEREPNCFSEESEDSDSEASKATLCSKPGATHFRKPSSDKINPKAELPNFFGSTNNLEKGDPVKYDFGKLGQVNE